MKEFQSKEMSKHGKPLLFKYINSSLYIDCHPVMRMHHAMLPNSVIIPYFLNHEHCILSFFNTVLLAVRIIANDSNYNFLKKFSACKLDSKSILHY